jgi:ABC-2 type transport system permease protein
MHAVMQIFKREFKSYFVSPIAYIVISIFLLVTGWFFFSPFFIYDQASLRSFFSLLPMTLAFVVPAVTMRLLAEERNVGSYEVLLTLPVTDRAVVIGKYLAGLAFVAVMLVPTLLYAGTVSMLGDLDWGPVIGGYLGALLLGSAFTAVGLMASALTRNQIIAFIVGAAICFDLALLDRMLLFLPRTLVAAIGSLGAESHFQNFSKGVIDSRDLLYFCSVTFVGLYGAYLGIEQR